MDVSAFLTSLPFPFEAAVRRAAALGFRLVDVVALAERPAGHFEVLADAGLRVACAALGRDLPDGAALDAPSLPRRREALDLVCRQIADAARLGATRAYVVSGMDATATGLERFTESCQLAADFAGARMVRLCVEHIPGRALPDVAAVLNWLDRVGHANLSLLLDLGHCLISKEDPAGAVRQAGARLGYVHVDDNDGQGDLHWPLLTGALTEATLTEFLASLRTAAYEGAVSLELNAKSAEPEEALQSGKALLERLGRL
jgi:sugar phosphate isomerase/epimerase